MPVWSSRNTENFCTSTLSCSPPSVEEFGGSLSVEAITDFVDNGGYVLVAGRSNPRDALMELAFKCEFEVDEENAAVIDHLNYDISDSEDHTLVGASPENLINSEIVIGKKSVGPLLYRGTGLLSDMENPLVLTAGSIYRLQLCSGRPYQ